MIKQTKTGKWSLRFQEDVWASLHQALEAHCGQRFAVWPDWQIAFGQELMEKLYLREESGEKSLKLSLAELLLIFSPDVMVWVDIPTQIVLNDELCDVQKQLTWKLQLQEQRT